MGLVKDLIEFAKIQYKAILVRWKVFQIRKHYNEGRTLIRRRFDVRQKQTYLCKGVSEDTPMGKSIQEIVGYGVSPFRYYIIESHINRHLKDKHGH